MRRTPLLLVVAAALLGSLGACGDDDDGSTDDGAAPASEISTEGVCEVLDAGRASEAMGVVFDKAVSAEGTCTYTSTASRTAFTLRVIQQGTADPAQALDTISATCDPETRRDRTFSGADGGFSCRADGVPNVVAAGGSVVLVLTGSSEGDEPTPDELEEGLVAILEDAIVGFRNV